VNYYNTFIAVAPDTSVKVGTIPVERTGKKTIAILEYELVSAQPYTYTQEEVQFAVHVQRKAVPSAELGVKRVDLWTEFFSKPMACMRASPLPKSYGWGLHFNEEGKVALVAVESPEYERLSSSGAIEQTRALRSRRT
jgi:hypothetical protein